MVRYGFFEENIFVRCTFFSRSGRGVVSMGQVPMTRDEALRTLRGLRRSLLPNGWLPTIDQLLDVCEESRGADPRLVAYLNQRPTLRRQLEFCLHPERALEEKS